MTAASLHARTGEIIGALAWLSVDLGYKHANLRYTGSLSGVYMGDLDTVDGLAAAWTGLNVKQFRGLASGIRDRIRKAVRAEFGIGGGSIPYREIYDLVRTSSYVNVNKVERRGDNGLVVGFGSGANAELLVGFIPEWGNGTSDANIAAKKKAVAKMAWSHDRTVEHAKTIRRERGISIRTVFDGMIKYRNQGLTASATVKKLL